MTAWPGLPLGNFDTRSGAKAATVGDVLDAQDHCQETLYDSGAGQLPDAPHVHSGADSPLIVMPDVPNLVTDCQPQATSAHNDLNNWSRTRVGIDGYGLKYTVTSSYATTPLGDAGNKLQFAGCDLLIALLVRTKSPMTSLTLKFGITDGHSATFATGTCATALVTQVPVGGYRRLFTIVRNFNSTAFASTVRVGVSTSGAFSPSPSEINVTGVLVKPCSVLAPFEPGYHTPRHHDWELLGMCEVPLLDDVLNFDRALYLAPA